LQLGAHGRRVLITHIIIHNQRLHTRAPPPEQVHNAAAACQASLAADAADVASSRDALAEELGATMGEFDGVARAVEELEVEVVDEVRPALAAAAAAAAAAGWLVWLVWLVAAAG